MNKISAIVLVKNSEDLITECLESLTWIDEIIVVDNGSTDGTVKKAETFPNVRVIKESGGFSERRDKAASKTEAEWLLYVDVDERVTPLLRKEIETTLENPSFSTYAIARRNIFLGHELRHGGWWPDYVLRLIKKEKLKGWKGELHEQPKVDGEIGKLREPLTHVSHRSLSEMVDKTNEWSEIEARLLYESGHPKMVWWRFFSVAAREFWYRGVKELGFLDGTVGIIEIIYQMFSRMITYAKLWEMQTKSKNQ